MTTSDSRNSFSDIVSAATTAITFAWANKAPTLFALALAVTGYTGYTKSEAILTKLADLTTITRPSPGIEANRARGEQNANAALVPAFEETREVTDADRVLLYLGHNNALGLGGDHWLYNDLRQAAVADGVAVDEAAEVNLRSSLWSVVEQKVNPQEGPAACAKWKVEEIPSSTLRNRLKATGTTLLYSCGVKDGAGVPRGFIVNSYMRRAPAASDKAIFEALTSLAAEVNASANETDRLHKAQAKPPAA